jgi:hypothetical protein
MARMSSPNYDAMAMGGGNISCLLLHTELAHRTKASEGVGMGNIKLT